MNDQTKIKFFPKSSMKAYDGMSVTADVWETAHNEHRDMMRAHLLSMHKPGIICGLEIKANDPADHYVFISPGAAIDDLGRVIVVDQPIAYDFGDEGAGTYLLLLGYSEHEKENSESRMKLMQHEYIIAARQSFPKQPVVELARLTISKKGNPIRDAEDPFQPEEDELDLRYRYDKNYIGDRVRVAVVTYPEDNDNVIKGWRVLMSELEQMLQLKLIVDVYPEIDERISEYDILYIGAAGTFKMSDMQLGLLKNFYNNGKGILLEGLDDAGSAKLKDIAVGFKAMPINTEFCRFFHSPFFFRLPPEQISEKNLLGGKKIIFCSDTMASAWGGELNGKPLPRSELRTNLEWGANLVIYCAK